MTQAAPTIPSSLCPVETAPAQPLPVRRLALNFLLLTAGECLAKLLTFTAFVYLARTLGPEAYGGVEFVQALMIFFTLGGDCGLGAYWAREIARNRTAEPVLLREVAALRLLLGCCSFLVLLLCVLLLPQGPEVKLLLVFSGLSLFVAPALPNWFFQGSEQMHWVALCSIARQGVFTGLLFLFLRPGSPLYQVGLLGFASVLVEAAISLYAVRRTLAAGRRQKWVPWRTLFGHLRRAVPIGGSELAWTCQWYFATVLLGLLVGRDALGWFGVSHRVFMALHTFIWLYFFNLVPVLSRCVGRPKEMRHILRRSLAATTWAGLLIALVGTLFARDALRMAYGPRFKEASGSFSILIWILPVAIFSGHYRYALIASNLQHLEFCCTATAAVVAIGLGFVLIPRYEAEGAALALLAANIVGLVLSFAVFQHRSRSRLSLPDGAEEIL